MEKAKKKSILCFVVACLVLVLSSCLPLFNFFSYTKKSGFTTTSVEMSGLDYLMGYSVLEAPWLITACIAAIYSLLAIFSSDAEKKEKRLEVAIALLFVGVLTFALTGKAILDDMELEIEIRNGSWVPMVIGGLITVGYSIIKFVLENARVKDKEEKAEDEDDLQKLVKYKELLDNGLITQEDYDNMKNKLIA